MEEWQFYYHHLMPFCQNIPHIELKRQVSIEIKFQQELIKSKYITPDFAIFNRDISCDPPLYIEYKGDWCIHRQFAFSAWTNELLLLASSHPDIFLNHYLIVGSEKLCKKVGQISPNVFNIKNIKNELFAFIASFTNDWVTF
jgi:hypothetical protein